ncbi:MAG: helix-turn-helix domain-containing protein [Candidatus Acidiferrum sp.]
MSGETPQLFDISAAAEYLRSVGATGATKNFIRGLICTGQVAHVRIGKKFYLSRQALNAWLAKHERRTQ